MSVPISIGMLSTFLFQVIDTYFVGQLGANALTALSFASTIYFLIVGLFIGLAVGASIIIGNAKGAQENIKVRTYSFSGILLAFVLTALIVLGLNQWMDQIFIALGAEANLIPLIKEYLQPLSYGLPLLTMGLMAGSALRATGNVTSPEIVMAIAGIINLFLDYTLIFGNLGFPELGIAGAAIATVASWVFIILGMTWLLFKNQTILIHLESLKSTFYRFNEILRVALPTMLTQIIGPLSLIYLTFIIANESQLAIAAFGVASRLESLLMIGILGVSSAITPFIAQNMGANKKIRVEEAIAFGGRASTYLGLLVIILLSIFIRPIAQLFTDSDSVIETTIEYFRVVSLSYISYGLYLITSSIYNGLKTPTNALKISLVKTFIFLVSFTLIGAHWGVFGIFIGLSLSNIAAGIYSAFVFKKSLIESGSSLASVKVLQEYRKDLVTIANYLFSRKKIKT